MLTDIIGKIRHKVRQRLVLLSMFNRLGVIGIKIRPYYLTEEFPLDETDLSLNPKLEPMVAGFLSSSEIKEICAHPETAELKEETEKILEDGCLCFGLKYNNEIVAYTWCDLCKCHDRMLLFLLKEDEVYLFKAYTYEAYRGKNLAPFLRLQLYKHLNEMGRTKFYSVTDFFNTPAVKFKKKLGAKPLKLFLRIGLFNKYHWNITLKEYQK